MRESMGATWIFSICLTFIILFTAYLAISVNYAKAFKIKSHIVTAIEQNEGYSDELGQEIEMYLTSQGYAARGTCSADDAWGDPTGLMCDAEGNCGVCIYEQQLSADSGYVGIDDIGASKAYYKVQAFFKFDLPIVGLVLPAFQVSGDTKYIYNFAG